MVGIYLIIKVYNKSFFLKTSLDVHMQSPEPSPEQLRGASCTIGL